jgi:hypothetical protein
MLKKSSYRCLGIIIHIHYDDRVHKKSFLGSKNRKKILYELGHHIAYNMDYWNVDFWHLKTFFRVEILSLGIWSDDIKFIKSLN